MDVAVKICGLTRLSDALDAAQLGADALGFNFWPGSKRYCQPETARAIISQLPPEVLPVGVFVNASPAEIERAVEQSGILVVQLHGQEDPSYPAQLSLPVIKALPMVGPGSLEALRAYPAAAFLLDTPTSGHGGSGRTFNWALVGDALAGWPVLVAGGLTPENVAEAVRALRPYGVDVASGVESAPGIKDRARMERFIRAAKEACR